MGLLVDHFAKVHEQIQSRHALMEEVEGFRLEALFSNHMYQVEKRFKTYETISDRKKFKTYELY